jgi:hypothetical protein
MWSVVTESPSIASTRAPRMSSTGCGSTPMSSKNVGLRTYVESGSHAKRSPVGTSSEFQRSSPENTSPYDLRNMSDWTADSTTCATSASLGQMSRSITSLPGNGSVNGSQSIVPASA